MYGEELFDKNPKILTVIVNSPGSISPPTIAKEGFMAKPEASKITDNIIDGSTLLLLIHRLIE